MLVAHSRVTYPCVERNGLHSHTMKIELGRPDWKPVSLLTAKNVRVNGDYLVIPRIKGTVETKSLDLAPFARNTHGLNTMIGKGHSRMFPLNAGTAWLIGMYVAEGYSSQGEVKIQLRIRSPMTRLSVSSTKPCKSSSSKLREINSAATGTLFASACIRSISSLKVPCCGLCFAGTDPACCW